MTTPENNNLIPSHTRAMEKAIPMTTRRIGSWEVLISRRPLSTTDLASRYDAASGKWARTERRFRLNTAYCEPLLTSQVVIDLMQVAPQARVLDCGVGNGSLSIALSSLMKGPVDFHAIDTSTEMLAQAKSVMQHAGLDPHLQQADVLSLPYKDQSFDVVIGRVIVVAGCMSAITGLWMTHFYVFPEALQGAALYWVRVVLGTAMIGLIIWAVIAIRSRNVFQHSASIVRAYAIGQGASTQAVLGIAWLIAVGSEAMGPLRDGLMIFAWVINLVAAEIFIHAMLRPPKRRQKHSLQPSIRRSTPRNET